MKKNSTILIVLTVLFLVGTAYLPIIAQTAVGGISPHQSAMLDVQSTSKGVLFPRMSTTDRTNITAAATGLMIYNTTTQCLEINLGSGSPSWQTVVCAPPLVGALDSGAITFNNFPLIPSQLATTQSITIPYTGGNGKDYDAQMVTSTGVTGLTANLPAGTLATGDGTLTYTISGTPSAYGTARFAINIGGRAFSLEVPMCGAYLSSGTNWKVFSCYNLGADGVTSDADPMMPGWQLIGNYYQWGKSIVAANGPTAVDPNDGQVATWSSSNAPNNSWQDGTKTANDPCPAGFRVPTKDQWEAVILNNTPQNPAAASWTDSPTNYSSGKKFGQGLFLPAAGLRGGADGALMLRGLAGYYATSSPNGSGAWNLYFASSGSPHPDPGSRGAGYSLRCVAVN